MKIKLYLMKSEIGYVNRIWEGKLLNFILSV